jgi:hypothetical protein
MPTKVTRAAAGYVPPVLFGVIQNRIALYCLLGDGDTPMPEIDSLPPLFKS